MLNQKTVFESHIVNGNFLQSPRGVAIGKFYCNTNYFSSNFHKKGCVLTYNRFEEIENRIYTFFLMFQEFFNHDWQTTTAHSGQSHFILKNDLFFEGVRDWNCLKVIFLVFIAGKCEVFYF